MNGPELRALLAQFKATLDPTIEYRDGVQMSDQELAEDWIGQFLEWLEKRPAPSPQEDSPE